jgi:hypothetical protein
MLLHYRSRPTLPVARTTMMGEIRTLRATRRKNRPLRPRGMHRRHPCHHWAVSCTSCRCCHVDDAVPPTTMRTLLRSIEGSQ